MKEKVRVSMGTLRVLGMEILQTDADPTTAYLQTYEPGRCSQACGFCAQARCSDAASENIARGLYPPRETKEVVTRLGKAYKKGLLKRACIQTMNYPGLFEDLIFLIGSIRSESKIPISASVYPLAKDEYSTLLKAGADRLVIPVDAATAELFDGIKGGKAGCAYRWETHMSALSDAADIFGKGNIGTHLIIGLGETEEEAVRFMQQLYYMGVYCALFAYTPVEGTRLKRHPPGIGSYRRIQLACHLIASSDDFSFEKGKITDYGLPADELDKTIDSGEPFMTCGCTDCNRPYSTEQPGGVIYNYPKKPSAREIKEIRKQLSEGL